MITFLDIDGVLNSHKPYNNGYCGIESDKVGILNNLIRKHNLRFVISSAWRYLILNKSMTIRGFENLLLTHGLNVYNRILDHTRQDQHPYEPRENVISDYITEKQIKEYIILDDMKLELPNYYQVKRGLNTTDEININKLIKEIKCQQLS